MIKKIISISLLCGACSVSAQNAFKAPLVKDSMLLDATVASSTVIVGERGHILVSSGDDSSFQQVLPPTTVTLTAIDGVNNRYITVGHDATVLMSDDNAQTWTVTFQNIELDRPFLDVIMLDEQHVVAVGGYGLFYRSMDGGINWTAEQHPSVLSEDDIDYLESIKDDPDFYAEELSFISPHFNRINQHDGRLFLAGEAGLLAVSEDQGKKWTRLEIDYFGSFFDFQQLSNGMFAAIGLRGNFFVTNSLEEEWTRIDTCVTTSLNAIVQNDQQVFVLGNNGVILNVDIDNLLSEEKGSENSEGCSTSAAVEKVSSDISEAISQGLLGDGSLTAITSDGLQRVKLTK